MDELVSVPVTHPVRFLKRAIKPHAPDPPVRQRADPPVRRKKLDPPTTSLQSEDPSVIPKRHPKNLAQEWLDF